MRIALVTEELARGMGSGGIGGAFHELALLLAKNGNLVDLIFVPCGEWPDVKEVRQYYAAHGIGLVIPDMSEYVWEAGSATGRAYAVFRFMQSLGEPYNVVHFHDYKGLGHYCLAAKRQRVAFPKTLLIVQVHGPTRWALESNGFPFSHEEQLKIDAMERASVAAADVLVSPSQYMLNWLAQAGWSMPAAVNIRVIQNPCGGLVSKIGPELRPVPLARNANELILFARHEGRKGICEFCDALDILAPELADAGVQVTFLGPLGMINGTGSLVYLAGRAKNWSFPLLVLPDMDRDAAAAYLIDRKKALVIVPSPVENSPYTVLETIALGRPLLTSCDGGAPELLDPAQVKAMTCRMTGSDLAAAIRRVLARGLGVPRAALAPERTDRLWLELHEQCQQALAADQPKLMAQPRPRVMVAITHYERPEKLFDAVMSIARQTYENLEIIVVDDGSTSERTLAALAQMQPLFDRLGVCLIRQQNGYLGAARNAAARATQSEYMLFLDDDDIAFPTLVSTLVDAAEATQASVMGCLNLFMEESRRLEAHPYPELFKQKASYVPLGGPLSLAPIDNPFGSATSLIRRSSYERIGGYTQERGVGHEDYEFYLRMLQAGMSVDVCPVPLYLYEVGRQSMISRTSQLKNFRRVAAAIDVSRQPEQWADFVSMSAGRRAVEHTENIRHYQNRVSPHATMLQRAELLPTNGPAYASVMAELAGAMGSANFARAMTSLAARRASAQAQSVEGVVGPDEFVELQMPVSLSGPGRVADPHVMAALVHLAMGRTAEAVAAFGLSVDRHRFLTAEQRRFLVELAAAPGTGPADLAPLIKTLRVLRGCKWTDEQLAPVLFRLVLRADAANLALVALDAVMAEDCAGYLAMHVDVQQDDPSAEAALRHFHKFGREEKRPGFATLLKLVAVLQDEFGDAIDLMAVRDAVVALDNKAVAKWTDRPQLARAE